VGFVRRLINALLAFILLIIGIDTLLRLLDANTGNVVVGVIRRVADWLLAPFAGIFDGQSFLLTALIAAIVYWLIAVLLRRITPRTAW
jgi:hypothetical protein